MTTSIDDIRKIEHIARIHAVLIDSLKAMLADGEHDEVIALFERVLMDKADGVPPYWCLSQKPTTN